MGLKAVIDRAIHTQKKSKLIKENRRLRDEIYGLKLELGVLQKELTAQWKAHVVGVTNGTHRCSACEDNPVE